MLNVPNLDDQRFEETLEAAIGKIPGLYPAWTDYNEHDPGITLLELFVWYKQMQQYHLNQVTPRNLEDFFKLLGITRQGMRPGECVFTPEADRPHPAGSRLITDAGVPFELTDAAPQRQTRICSYLCVRPDGVYDMTDVLQSAQTPFAPFGTDILAKAPARLLLGLEGLQDTLLTLWVTVEGDANAPRNPFAADSRDPRRIRYTAWSAAGQMSLEVLRDETRAFSRSGCITLRAPQPFARGDAEQGREEHFWLMLALEDTGCEEMPRISRICPGYARASQRVTLSEVHAFTAVPGSAFACEISTRLAAMGYADFFARDDQGWFPADCQADLRSGEGTDTLAVAWQTPQNLAQDGPNLRVICYDPAFAADMQQDATGLPGQRVLLPVEDGSALGGEMKVMCRSWLPDGSQRWKDWAYTDALSKAGPHSRCFAIEENTGEICFGDNACGRAPEAGQGAIYIAALCYTQAGEGGVTPGAQLMWQDETPAGKVLAAVAGRDAETIDAMRVRLREMLNQPAKAVTAADCEAIARRTPGLRVAQAKALPLFKPGARSGQAARAHVTMVVQPVCDTPFPKPDQRFLDAVQRQMDAHRTVCTCMHVIGPSYVPVSVWAEVLVRQDEEAVRAQMKAALEEYFSPARQVNRLGEPVRVSDITACLGACPAVLGILRLDLKAQGGGCKKNEQGDVLTPPNAIACLNTLDVHATHA